MMINKTTPFDSDLNSSDVEVNDAGLAAVGPLEFYNGHNYVIEESIGYLIKHAQLALNRTIDTKMAGIDLTALQWAPLLLIAHGKGRTAAELSRCSGVDTSTMTRMLDRLESKGLICRNRCEKDRRIIYLELTDTGKEFAAKVPYVIAESFNHHLRGFTNEEVNTLKSLLRRIKANEES
ncbi:MarR family winged helix-turn-helix transcriptional regulator [Methyloradius palustris]|uniref:MarR family transcriptional regulator n=1 Tax=Methyloradius palustris TaxID=2778876 RepID=A0A8D5FYA9_9PROT|nr:MarR family transcriptional regulator [Methyloradius palustris]BCM24272.1 MarR family transcriptional regulator [Methyloradius palustris]